MGIRIVNTEKKKKKLNGNSDQKKLTTELKEGAARIVRGSEQHVKKRTRKTDSRERAVNWGNRMRRRDSCKIVEKKKNGIPGKEKGRVHGRKKLAGQGAEGLPG